jgi:Prp8 binding protein
LPTTVAEQTQQQQQPAAATTSSSTSYYKTIKGVRYDRAMIELAEACTKGKRDGRMSKADATALWDTVIDGDSITATERATLLHIQGEFTFTAAASKHLEALLAAWDADHSSNGATAAAASSSASSVAVAMDTADDDDDDAAAAAAAAPAAEKKQTAKKQTKTKSSIGGSGYYAVIDGEKYDREMLEVAARATRGAHDNVISKREATELFDAMADGARITAIERATLAKIQADYKFTDAAAKHLRELLAEWGDGAKKQEKAAAATTITTTTAATTPTNTPTSAMQIESTEEKEEHVEVVAATAAAPTPSRKRNRADFEAPASSVAAVAPAPVAAAAPATTQTAATVTAAAAAALPLPLPEAGRIKRRKMAMVLAEDRAPPPSGAAGMGALTVARANANAVQLAEAKGGFQRTSALQAPTMLLAGHKAPVYCVRFSHEGKNIASGSLDTDVLLWGVYGDCECSYVLKGHKNAVLDLNWSRDDAMLYTASADKTALMFDLTTGDKAKTFRGHAGAVNSIEETRRGVVSVLTASDDCTARIWDLRYRKPQVTFTEKYPITSALFSDDSSLVFTAGIDPQVKCYDLRFTSKVLYTIAGAHTDTVTGMQLSPTGRFLLSNGMDNTMRMYDVRAYVAGGDAKQQQQQQQSHRLLKTFRGGTHDFQKNLQRCGWSPDEKRVSGGSANRFVNVWDVATTNILYALPGHTGCVNDVQFHPTEPIIASCGSDRKIYLGEL